MQILIQSNISELTKGLNAFKDQIPFATSQALNTTAFDARTNSIKQMSKDIDKPTKFTLSGVQVKKSNKRSLTAEVFIPGNRYKYLKHIIEGGTYRPPGRAFAIGISARRNQYGNTTRGAAKKALSKPNTFSGTVKGVAGIWQRYKRSKRLKLLFAYHATTRYQANQFKYYANVNNTIDKTFNKNFTIAFKRAIKTARFV